MIDKLISQKYIIDYQSSEYLIFRKSLPILGSITLYLYPEYGYYEYFFQRGHRGENPLYAEFFKDLLFPYKGMEL